MKKRLLYFNLVMLLCFSAVACKSSDITISLSADKLSLTLYETVTVTTTVTNSQEKVVFSADSDNIELTADGNTVTVCGRAAGEYTLTATVGKVSHSIVISVQHDTYDVFAEVKKLGVMDSVSLVYNAAALLQENTVSDIGVYDADLIQMSNIISKYDVTTQTLTLSESDLENIGLGEYTVRFSTSGGDKAFTLTIATLLIDSYEKFTSTEFGMPSYHIKERINTNPLKDGYFVLMRDINFEGKPEFAMNTDSDGTSGMPAGPYEYENSWFGAFDGRGNVVTDIIVDRYGIFAHIGAGAIIKNFGVLNAKIYVPSGNIGYLFSFGNDGVIDNCYAEIIDFPAIAETAIFCRQVRFAGSVTNSIAAVKTEDSSSYASTHGAVLHHNYDSTTVKNVYLLRRGANNKAVINDYGNSGVWGTFEFCSDLIAAVNRRYYDQLEGATKSEVSFDGFDKKHWTIDSDNGHIYFGTHKVYDAEN